MKHNFNFMSHNLQIFFFAFATVLFASCGRTSSKIQTGDLLFVGLPLDYTVEGDTASMADAIASATGSESHVNFIHVAILEVGGDTTWVIDATIKRGVARYPLDSMREDFRLRSGGYPVFSVKRLRHNRNAEQWIANARKYVGQRYDMAFLPDNDEQYCSELVWNSYLDGDGEHIFSAAPMNFKSPDGSYPPYWVWLFAQLGMPIPQGVMGTNPNDMAADKLLQPVCTL